MKVKIKKLDPHAVIPKYQTKGSAGFDFHALHTTVIAKKATVLLHTGLAFAVPEGYELQVIPRSGISLKTKLRIANSPGCVDSDYRNEVCVIVENTGDESFTVNAGERIAQGKIVPIVQAEFEEVEELDETERKGGFGSTGTK